MVDKLTRLVKSEAKKLSRRATWVDLIDSVTGPLSSMFYYSGSEYLFQLGVGISIAEIALVKLPFMYSYIKKTGDYKSLIFLGPKEALANMNQLSGFLDIIPAYKLRVDYFLRDHLDDSS